MGLRRVVAWFREYLVVTFRVLFRRRRARVLAYLFAALAGTALALVILQSMLYVPRGFGVEDFLGWTDPDALGEMRTMWQRSYVDVVARFYLVFDTVLFVPIYVALFLTLAFTFSCALADRKSREFRFLVAILSAFVLSLATVDLVENGIGLVRIGVADDIVQADGIVLAALSTFLALLALAHLSAMRLAGSAIRLAAGIAAIVVAVMFVIALNADECATAASTVQVRAWAAGCAAHVSKKCLALLVLGSLAVTGFAWLFGLHVGTSRSDAEQRSLTALRRALWRIVVRSRYPLAAIALMAAFTVVTDQARDVVYAVAAWPFCGVAEDCSNQAGRIAGMLAVFVMSCVAVWLLVYACWLWTRSVVQLRAVHSATDPAAVKAAPQDTFAKHWTRTLALLPLALLVLMCAGVIKDAAMAQGGALAAVAAPEALSFPESRWLGPVWVVVAFAIVTVLLGVVFLHFRIRYEERRYYDYLTWREWLERAGFAGAKHDLKYCFAGRVSPFWLPVLIALGLLLSRTIDVMTRFVGATDYVPTMAFPVVVLSIALWLCFFGWLSMLESHRSIPWVFLLALVVGVLGVSGLTENHVVWPGVVEVAPTHRDSWTMSAFSFALLALCVAAYFFLMHLVRRNFNAKDAAKPRNFVVRAAVGSLLLYAAMIGVLVGANAAASSRKVDPAALAADQRPTLGQALERWLRGICNGEPEKDCEPTLAKGGDGGYDVYFISSEGGGIRAAVWTSFVLQSFARQDPQFLARTFSISGVSGGAVGAAAFRACAEAPALERYRCLDRVAKTDMLAPVASAWMFEDAVAHVLPTSWCHTPGCGILSRGTWFEQTLETSTLASHPDANAPVEIGFRRGLLASRIMLSKTQPHVPYLLLNSTWVESGERAIASDLQIDWRNFHGAKDQIAITGSDISLATAAHNSARFPYINAIGALAAPANACKRREDAASKGPTKADDRPVCGHLADGGYFDNSGGQTTVDVLQALGRCLDIDTPDPADREFDACLGMDPKHRKWLRRNLVPHVLMIRNSVNPATARENVCSDTADKARVSKADVATIAPGKCAELSDAFYHPERPACRPRASLFVGVVGPAITALQVGGIGANGRLAEARQAHAVRALRVSMGGVAATTKVAPVRVIDLLPNGTRFPLGWHLSPLAVGGIETQARNCELAGIAATAASAR